MRRRRPDVNLFFDLDGTLTDPRQGILACFRYALNALGVDAPPDHHLEPLIGPPLRESFSALLPEEALVEQAVALYRERFAPKGMFENRVYAGVAGALEQLHQAARGSSWRPRSRACSPTVFWSISISVGGFTRSTAESWTEETRTSVICSLICWRPNRCRVLAR